MLCLERGFDKINRLQGELAALVLVRVVFGEGF